MAQQLMARAAKNQWLGRTSYTVKIICVRQRIFQAESGALMPLLARGEHTVKQEECKMKWDTSRGSDSQGGMLYLTDHRLIFEGNIGGLL